MGQFGGSVLLRIRWQDRITNEEVLQWAQMTSIEAMLIKSQLRWSGNVMCMDDSWLPKCALYGELSAGKHSAGGQYLRYKDSLKHCLKKCNVSLADWEQQATHRSAWRGIIHDGINHFVANQAVQAQVKRSTRKLKIPSYSSRSSVLTLPVQSAATSVLHASVCSAV